MEKGTVEIFERQLSDDEAVSQFIDDLGLAHRNPKELPGPNPPYWARYLHKDWPAFKWHKKFAVWLFADVGADKLRCVVVSGLKDEKEAKLLRSEIRRRSAGIAEIETIVDEVISTREERAYQETFRRCLKDVRFYFTWDNGRIIESDGRILPISAFNLRPGDQKLLQDVFALLPRTQFRWGRNPSSVQVDDERCPTCGGKAKAQIKTAQDLRAARKEVKKHAAQFSDEGFTAWVSERLQVKTDKWTRSKSVLYEDYKKWIRTYGDNNGERVEAKSTALSLKKWGALMRKLADYERDGKGGRYRVALKRQQQPAQPR